MDLRYEYLLPIFVGHPFAADYTQTLRAAIQSACQRVNEQQPGPDRRYLCVPQFLNYLDHSNLATILETVRESIRQSALAVFDVSQRLSVNVFLELGVAIGMNRPAILLGRKPYDPPADLRGYRALEYASEDELCDQLTEVIRLRVAELSRPPLPEQQVVHQKMQIDAVWEHRISWAENALYFLAGDVSWARALEDKLRPKTQEGVLVRVCCKRPRPAETLKWENIRRLCGLGAEVRLFEDAHDPGLRGFIWEPQRPHRCEAVFVDKERRRGSRRDFESSGATIGESEYLYTANLYNGQSQPRLVTAVVRLFESLWQSLQIEPFPPER